VDEKTLFALDIGTRKILGLVMQKKDSVYSILGIEMLEHSTRAMLDGQIHDVEAVSTTIRKIKESLENKLDIKLNYAAVAAAGRSLQTTFGNAKTRRSILNEIIREEVNALEIEAVQSAQYQLSRAATTGKDNYFCVGYSVMTYYLDGQVIGNLVGQRGEEIAVDIIATFLPRVVVDSLFSALNRAGLEANSLTLEPIAALSVAIPPEMRMLNLALVDIGAGTSDLAIVKNGKISAYAMVPCAGDELTEQIASEYLLDFNSAESLKRQISSQDEVEIKDILGNMFSLSSLEVMQALQPVVNEVVSNIAANILELNQNKPDAVVCVGGGSLTPGLTDALADKLGIVSRRVGLRTPENFNKIKIEDENLTGPQGVTPLGIAYHALSNPPVPFVKVTINGREMSLWNVNEFTIANALLSSGINLGNIYGRPGMGITVEINGTVKTIKGEVGHAPIIKINGQDVSLDSVIQDGDCIEFTRGQDGKDGRLFVKELVQNVQSYVQVNGQKQQIVPRVCVNGIFVEMDYEIPDRAVVEFKQSNRLDSILQQAGLPERLLGESTYYCYINGVKKTLKWKSILVKVNDKEAELTDIIEPGSNIIYALRSTLPLVKDFVDALGNTIINVQVNGEAVSIKKNSVEIIMNDQAVSLEDKVTQGATIIVDRRNNPAILSDIFSVVDIKPVAQKRLVMKVDGCEAGFTTPIFNNSSIEIIWSA